MKKSRIWTPPQSVWKIVDAAENASSESTYSSALENWSENGRKLAGAMLLLNLAIHFGRLEI